MEKPAPLEGKIGQAWALAGRRGKELGHPSCLWSLGAQKDGGVREAWKEDVWPLKALG